MGKTKAELLEEAKKLNLEVIEKNTVKEIEEAIASASTQESEDKEEKTDAPVAKAGKRSEKGLKEAEEKAAKIEQQKAGGKEASSEEVKPKAPAKPARPRIERQGKKFREAAKKIEKNKIYDTKDAVKLAIETSTTMFDSTVELHVRLNVDPKQADQNIRDNLTLPAGTGKTVRVAVFAEEDIAKEALQSGADVAGFDDFLKQLDKGTIDFDVLIATPNVMAKLSKYARVLGPKGLMPNPKSGTVTKDVAKAVKESKAGKVEYRVDSTGIVHLGIGKVSFGADKIAQNLEAVFASLRNNKPTSVKGAYTKSITLTTSMGPGIKLNPSELS